MRMMLKDDENGWYLLLQDGLVQLIQIDFRLGLFLSDTSGKAQLYIETPCLLSGPGGDVSLTPSQPSSLAPILPLFNAKVLGVSVQKTGKLKVEFADGFILEVGPDGRYEAWQLGCSPPVECMFVCGPGGSVSLFKQN